MRKYRLIKKYPGLPEEIKVGYIVKKSDTYNDYYEYSFKLIKNGSNITKLVHYLEVENYPEFWEEVKELPASWDEVNNNYKEMLDVYNHPRGSHWGSDTIPYPSPEERDAEYALRKLLILRNIYRNSYQKGWRPDWDSDFRIKYIIYLPHNKWKINSFVHFPFPFSFPTKELAEQFLNNFKDNLLEEVKPLFSR
jgi:hypothetical protein